MQQMLSKHVLATKMHHFLVEGVFVTNLGIQHMESFPCPPTIYLKKYYSGLCIHYGVDLWFSISFRIQTDGALLTLRTPAQ